MVYKRNYLSDEDICIQLVSICKPRAGLGLSAQSCQCGVYGSNSGDGDIVIRESDCSATRMGGGSKAENIGITLLFFFIARLCEIGGGYLV